MRTKKNVTIESLAREIAESNGRGRLDDALRKIVTACVRLGIVLEVTEEDAARIRTYRARIGRPQDENAQPASVARRGKERKSKIKG